MNKIWESPNLISVVILLVVLAVAAGYVAFTLAQRPETESFTVGDNYFFPYNFDRLDRVVKLPSDLIEISGLTAGFNRDEVFAIQDELGVLFLVNSRSGQVVQQVSFDKNRDYEGVTRKNRDMYVLETDGDIHYFPYADSITEVSASKLETAFSYRNDTEGISYDSLTNSLLIVPKEQELNPAGSGDRRRGIYSFDLHTQTLNTQPSYYIDELEVGQIVYGKNREYSVKPSGIAVDPYSGYVFVISSVGHILVVLNRESQIQHVELLEKGVFGQPEGIAFAENGDLYLSSEGRSGLGIIATLTRQVQSITDEQR